MVFYTIFPSILFLQKERYLNVENGIILFFERVIALFAYESINLMIVKVADRV